MMVEVIRPASSKEVAEAFRQAKAQGRKVRLLGRGVGLEASGDVFDGLLLDFSGMGRVQAIERGNLLARVEAGAVHAHVQAALEKEGLFFPPDPTSLASSTIGGNAASGAFGPRQLKYGGMRDFILGMEVVLPTGEVVRLGGNTKKCVAGYDMARFFIGSKGCFGAITELTLRLLSLPQYRRTYMFVFQNLLEGSRAALAVLKQGMTPAAMELLDGPCLQAIGWQGSALLLVELDGVEALVLRHGRELERVGEAFECSHARSLPGEEATSAWEARRSLLPSLIRQSPTWLFYRLAIGRKALPSFLHSLPSPSQARLACFAHAGSGILHLFLGFDPQQERAVEEARHVQKMALRILTELQGAVLATCGPGRQLLPLAEAKKSAWEDKLHLLHRALDPKGVMDGPR